MSVPAWHARMRRLYGLPLKEPKSPRRYPLRIEARTSAQLLDDVLAVLTEAPQTQPAVGRQAHVSSTRAREVLRALESRCLARRVPGGWVR
ncbi:MAG: hypothetical protein ACYCT1_08275 [Steroidobacteraceae bacterium]